MSKDWDLRLNAGADETIRRAANRGLNLAGEYVLGESNRVVPIEEGTLTRSGAVTSDSATLRVAVSYDTPYAVRQHEELDYRHDPGRKAKYLEDALTNNREEIKRIIAGAIRGEL